jgi:hypothetical protein
MTAYAAAPGLVLPSTDFKPNKPSDRVGKGTSEESGPVRVLLSESG